MLTKSIDPDSAWRSKLQSFRLHIRIASHSFFQFCYNSIATRQNHILLRHFDKIHPTNLDNSLHSQDSFWGVRFSPQIQHPFIFSIESTSHPILNSTYAFSATQARIDSNVVFIFIKNPLNWR